MFLIGCVPKGRNIEQHDVFFGIGNSVAELLPHIKDFWPEAGSTLHIDAWRPVTRVNGYSIEVSENITGQSNLRLFFINLGGYKKDEFEEFHYKMIVPATDKGEAVKRSKQTAFFKHTGFKGASAHIDDKYGVDVDDVYAITDILPKVMKNRYSIVVSQNNEYEKNDELHLGYFKPEKVEKWGD
jgi:hypothetical protein